jgi:hypothetical protein
VGHTEQHQCIDGQKSALSNQPKSTRLTQFFTFNTQNQVFESLPWAKVVSKDRLNFRSCAQITKISENQFLLVGGVESVHTYLLQMIDQKLHIRALKDLTDPVSGHQLVCLDEQHIYLIGGVVKGGNLSYPRGQQCDQEVQSDQRLLASAEQYVGV